jgi:POT family proton-dependent oligopeptide transporter
VTKPQQETLFGHPVGLYTLFFAEMWERFSYYGMRALLIFYMTKGFLEYPDGDAYKVYGAYTSLVYMTPFFGGMLADRLLGARRCVVLGGLLMAAGHLVMTVELQWAFYIALALLVIGNGFFKPNISTIVGTLYGDHDPRRDAGFTIFYIGINLGAATAPLLCGYVGEKYGWHLGFGLATLGMLTGLAVFVLPRIVAQLLILAGAFITAAAMIKLGWEENVFLFAANAFVALALMVSGVIAFLALARGGLPAAAGAPPDPQQLSETVGGLPRSWLVYLSSLAVVPAIAALIYTNRGVVLIPATWLEGLATAGETGRVLSSFLKEISTPTGLILLAIGLAALVYLAIEALRSNKIERERLFVAIILMFFSLLFWAFFEQAGSSINNFTDRNVDRVLEERQITRNDVGTTIDIELTQEQLGYANGDEMMNMTVLTKARDEAREMAQAEAQDNDKALVQWSVDSDDVGMGVGGSEIPASTFQSINPICIIVMGLVFTMLWGFLGKRKLEPSTTFKFALGLAQLSLGFVAIWWGAQTADERGMVAAHWLMLCFFLHTTGELCLSPVGLAMVTRLSPLRLVSTVMGAWFLATSLSNYLAAVIAAFTRVDNGVDGEQVIPIPSETVNIYGEVFGQIAIAAAVSAGVCFLLVPLLNRWMHEEAPDHLDEKPMPLA